MSKILLNIFFALLLTVSTTLAYAVGLELLPGKYNVDPAHSRVSFFN